MDTVPSGCDLPAPCSFLLQEIRETRQLPSRSVCVCVCVSGKQEMLRSFWGEKTGDNMLAQLPKMWNYIIRVPSGSMGVEFKKKKNISKNILEKYTKT